MSSNATWEKIKHCCALADFSVGSVLQVLSVAVGCAMITLGGINIPILFDEDIARTLLAAYLIVFGVVAVVAEVFRMRFAKGMDVLYAYWSRVFGYLLYVGGCGCSVV